MHSGWNLAALQTIKFPIKYLPMLIRIFLFFALFFHMNLLFSQKQIDRRETFFDAQYFLSYEDYSEAVHHFLKLHNFEPFNAHVNYKTGKCYLNIIGSKTKAIPYMESAINNTARWHWGWAYIERRAPYEAFLKLGRAYRINNELEKAEEMINHYRGLLRDRHQDQIARAERELEICGIAREMQKKPVYFRDIHLGESINTRNNNFNPAVSGDEFVMVYMTSLPFYDGVFFSKNVKGEWTPGVNIVDQIESDGDHYVSSLNYDGTEMYFVKGDKFKSDIYVSHYSKEKEQWGKLEKLNDNINTSWRESHASVTKDGNTLYFTSNRPGGFGGLDIYKSNRTRGGDWGPAVNLGSKINSKYHEKAPFVTKDGETLIFSSFGHYNMGEFSIFRSDITEEGEWGEPQIKGYPLNTTDDNLFFVPVRNAEAGYYSKFDGNNVGGSDIYIAEFLPEKTPPEPEKEPLMSPEEIEEIYKNYGVRITDTLDADAIALVTEDPESGEAEFTTTPEKFNEWFRESPEKLEHLIPCDCDTTLFCINIRPVFFEFDKYEITPYARLELERLASIMKEYPDLEIEVVGHACNMGSVPFNQRLSENRAKSVAEYLISSGICEDRISWRGESELSPIAINTNPDGTPNKVGRIYNRRADIIVVHTEHPYIVTEEIFIPEELKIKEQEEQ